MQVLNCRTSVKYSRCYSHLVIVIILQLLLGRPSNRYTYYVTRSPNY